RHPGGADGFRRHLRHELRRYAGTEDGIWLPHRPRRDRHDLLRSLLAVQEERLAMTSPAAAPLRRRLERQAGMVFAIRTGFGGLVAAEMKVLGQRIAVRPLAGALGQFDEMQVP